MGVVCKLQLRNPQKFIDGTCIAIPKTQHFCSIELRHFSAAGAAVDVRRVMEAKRPGASTRWRGHQGLELTPPQSV
jgi:hypothetical protein